MIVNYCILGFINDIISTNTMNWDERTLTWDGFREIFTKLIKQVKTDGYQL